jgi:16S rRNA (adenine1518-N6/adenine1519-N6)-dimethyltransferase
VGTRLCAAPHGRDFGFLSVFVQNLATATLVRKIGPDAFRPRPKVLSATVRLEPLPSAKSLDPFFLSFVELCFTQKRKKLTNVIAPFYPKAKVLETLAALGIREDARAEDLGVDEFVAAFSRLGPPPGVPAHKGLTGGLPMDGGLDLDEDELDLMVDGDDVTEGDEEEKE